MKYTIQGPFRTVLNNETYLVNGKITVEQDEMPVPIKDFGAKYTLVYRKLNGVTRDYKIKEITSMSNTHLKANVAGRGYRTFILNRVRSLTPL